MAYNARNLILIAHGAQAASGGKNANVFAFNTNDLASEVEAANYFNGAVDELAVGDTIVAAIDTDGTPRTKLYAVVSNTGAAVGIAPLAAGLQASAALDFPSINAVSQADLTITVPGAAVGDAVAMALPSAPTAGIVFNAFVSAADTVTIRASNITAGAINQASATFGVTVLK